MNARDPGLSNCFVSQDCAGTHTAGLSILVACVGPLLFGLTSGFTSPALATMANQVVVPEPGGTRLLTTPQHLLAFTSAAEAGLFASIVNIGAVPGALLGGPLANKIGRRRALQMLSPVLTVAYVLLAVGEGRSLFFSRFLMGIGIGACTVVVPMYIAEAAPTRHRGTYGTLNQLSFSLGVCLVYFGGSVLKEGHFCQWRTLAAIIAVPALLLGVFISFAPETPDFYMHHDEWALALRSSRKLRRPSKQKQVEALSPKSQESLASPLPSSSPSSLPSPQTPSPSGSGSQVIHHRKSSVDSVVENQRPISIAIGIMILKAMSGENVIIYYLNPILTAAGVSWANRAGALTMFIMLLMTALATTLVEVAGRRSLLLASCSLMSFSCCILAVSLHGEFPPWGAVIGSISFVCAYGVGVGPIPWLLVAEILPTDVRGLACSIATCCNWLGAFVVTATVGPLQATIGYAGLFSIYCCILALSLFFVAVVVIETKGKSVEAVVGLLKEPLLRSPKHLMKPDEPPNDRDWSIAGRDGTLVASRHDQQSDEEEVLDMGSRPDRMMSCP